MKKIMIYTKRGGSVPALRKYMPINADAVLFLVVFICGLMTGCSLYFSVGAKNVFSAAVSRMAEYGILQNVLLRAVICLVIVIAGFIGGTGAAGMIPLVLLPLLGGAVHGMIASEAMLSAANGFGKYALTVLPGGILYFASLICFCTESADTSKKTAALLFFRRTEHPEVKRYAIRCAVWFGAMLLGAMTDHITDRIFSGLF